MLENFSKAIIWYTIPNAARERNSNLNKATSALAAILASVNSRSSKASHIFIENLKVEPSSVVEETNLMLGKLGLNTLPYLDLPTSPKAVSEGSKDLVSVKSDRVPVLPIEPPLTESKSKQHSFSAFDADADIPDHLFTG